MTDRSVSEAISPDDSMFKADSKDLERYMSVGRQAVDLLRRFSDSPKRILDFGCGHGRVLRFIVAEFPGAEVWACDIDADAVQFCEQEFGVKGAVSSTDASLVVLPRFDVIWVGSVLTHLRLDLWRECLDLLARSLDGVLVMSVTGPFLVERLREGERMGFDEAKARVLDDYETTGFGYSEYRGNNDTGYGFTCISPVRLEAELERAGSSW